MVKKKSNEKTSPVATTAASDEPINFPIQVNVLNQLEGGNVELEVSYSDEFRSWFMKNQGLKKWSEKRFQKVVGPLLQEYYDNLSKQPPATTESSQVDPT